MANLHYSFHPGMHKECKGFEIAVVWVRDPVFAKSDVRTRARFILSVSEVLSWPWHLHLLLSTCFSGSDRLYFSEIPDLFTWLQLEIHFLSALKCENLSPNHI